MCLRFVFAEVAEEGRGIHAIINQGRVGLVVIYSCGACDRHIYVKLLKNTGGFAKLVAYFYGVTDPPSSWKNLKLLCCQIR